MGEGLYNDFSNSPSNRDHELHIRVFVHVITDQTGYTEYLETEGVVIQNAIDIMKDDYDDHNIYFHEEITYESNQQFYEGTTSICELFEFNARVDGINIYILPPDNNFPATGRAMDIPSNAFYIKGSWFDYEYVLDTSIISHEMGHCLGLYHTYRGAGGCENDQEENECTGETSDWPCNDLTGGNNDCINTYSSSNCGDFICDTPPDWCHQTSQNLVTGINNETCEFNYIPDNYENNPPSSTNIMTYTYPWCYEEFTDGQINRIYDSVENSYVLQQTLINVVHLENKNLDDENIGGALWLNNLDTDYFEYFHIPSGSNVEVELGDNYSVGTLDENIDDYYTHINWNNDFNRIKRVDTGFQMNEEKLTKD